MLDTTLATTFTPGTNLKGEVAGANWTFLLPSLELELIVCLGRPSPAAVTTLGRMGQVAIVIDGEEPAESRNGRHAPDFSGAGVLVRDSGKGFPFPDDRVDLVVVTGSDRLQQLASNEARQTELQRILKPQGLIYVEPDGLLNGRQSKKAIKELAKSFGRVNLFWLTPLRGESHTAVPFQDYKTIHYFLDQRLHSPSVTASTFGNVKRLLKRPGAGKRSGPSTNGTTARPAGQSRSRLWSSVRAGGKGLLQLFGDVERLALKHVPFTRRHGAFLGTAAPTESTHLPQYLSTLAREAGADVDNYRWGLVARGDYSSRKLLFFLFPRDDKSAAGTKPAFVVKMVRDPQYNPRLENECRALSLLKQEGVGTPETLPQVAFWGYHNDLAIIGETAIEGVPFRERTTATAGCPYLLAALDWFTALGAATADPTVATPAEVATVLRTLFTRFTEIYRLAPEHRAFLEGQLAIIADSRRAFPLVFQHGDPGPWNALVTPGEKVAFLDWEAAEPQGMPLWDLFYFMRSYCVGAARALGTHDRLKGFAEQFLSDTPLSRLVIDTVDAYRKSIGLDSAMVEPLFYTCWMHRALKESARWSPSRLERGHYVNLLRLCIEWRQTPTLDRLFSGPTFKRRRLREAVAEHTG